MKMTQKTLKANLLRPEIWRRTGTRGLYKNIEMAFNKDNTLDA